MKVIVTGMGGTVAPALAARLARDGHEIVRWNRATDPPDTEALVSAFIERHKPDWVCHVATGAPDWARWIARSCAGRSIPLLWTGTVSVFSPDAEAPLTPDRAPDATDDYGKYKIEVERLVLRENPGAVVARLGWQIAPTPGSNSMTDFLARAAAGGAGVVHASTRWIPSCCFLEDTADALAGLMSRPIAGISHIEGNSAGLSLFDLARGVAALLKARWRVEQGDEPVRDNRMREDRLVVGQVAARLTA